MIEQIISNHTATIVNEAFGLAIEPASIQIQKTLKDFEGNLTVVVFPFVKAAKKSPEQTAQFIGEKLMEICKEVTKFNVVKGFLNLEVDSNYYLKFLETNLTNSRFGFATQTHDQPIVLEYSSPNTNKPLHLGHIRNNLLGWSVAEILKANGYDVKKVNLVNDRGIHICKSMLAWQLYGNGETPETTGLKGDHLVGKYYVKFDQVLKSQIAEMVASGTEQEIAEKSAPILLQAQDMLRKWEAGDEQIRSLWERMNGWVYAGFDETYKKMGVDFDKIYYESQTYLLGKEIALKGLSDKHLVQHEDNSVWADLREDGLDEKLLLRKDGTSVYMTQDLGTAKLRHDEFNAEKMIYVVGNEQNYHFDVLKIVLKKLGYAWSDTISHLSYGMVELPEGKMKSREGTVVDADDLIESMVETARKTTEELGKIDNFKSEEANALYQAIALGALKYFILKVDPVKNMLFNPNESIDFNGNTGPFIQYTHARIRSLIKRSGLENLNQKTLANISILDKEKQILMLLHDFPSVVKLAGDNYSPALIANYAFDLAKEFNGFYQDIPVLKEENQTLREFRLALSKFTADVLKNALGLLGITAPERM
ncbi:MAG: arginine--tRNA ligase [Bacteroidales bacterium]|jgi:arginyl-tRNA synthetase|nr:arginine--tRNA ligase [Bacteroidales bacterium]